MVQHYNDRIIHLNNIRKKLGNSLYGLDGDSEVFLSNRQAGTLITSLREVNKEINTLNRLSDRVCHRKAKINKLK